MPACSRCLVEVPPGTALCPKCGAAIRPLVLQRPPPKPVGKTQQRLNALDRKDRVFGPATLVLLISFWLPWYSIGPFSFDGLTAHGWLFIAVLNSIVLVLYMLVTAFGVGDLAAPGRLSKDQLLALLTGINLVLVALAFLLKPSWLELVMGRLPGAGRRHRGFSALWSAPYPGPTRALNPACFTRPRVASAQSRRRARHSEFGGR